MPAALALAVPITATSAAFAGVLVYRIWRALLPANLGPTNTDCARRRAPRPMSR
jgi:hypothetical protein